MHILAEKEKRIRRLLEDLPGEQVDEVIDFVEYIKARKKAILKPEKKKGSLRIPTFHLGRIAEHAFDRDVLYGEYLDQKFD
jgi:hypothetical protein